MPGKVPPQGTLAGIICHAHLQYVGAKCNASLWTAFMVEEDGKENGRRNWCSLTLKNGGTGLVEMARTIFRWGTCNIKHGSRTTACELERAQGDAGWAESSDWIHRLVSFQRALDAPSRICLSFCTKHGLLTSMCP